jgi:hypothetical protein
MVPGSTAVMVPSVVNAASWGMARVTGTCLARRGRGQRGSSRPNPRVPSPETLKEGDPATGTAAGLTNGAACRPNDGRDGYPTARAFLAWTRFVDAQGAAVKFAALQALDGRLPFGPAAHGHKGKPARAARVTVADQDHFGHGAKRLERRLEVVGGGLKREVSHVKLHASGEVMDWRLPAPEPFPNAGFQITTGPKGLT